MELAEGVLVVNEAEDEEAKELPADGGASGGGPTPGDTGERAACGSKHLRASSSAARMP